MVATNGDDWRSFPDKVKLQLLRQLRLRAPPIAAAKIERIRWCPHAPFPRQAEFLALECQEALFGGAAGGGKSDAILMAALQYVDVPGYAALILRRDYPRLALAGAIMDRAKQWLAGTPARWNEQAKRFDFPSGAVLQFGFIDRPDDRFRYASAEYQFVGWEELTEFRLPSDESNPYQFMFSRLRKPRDLPVPLRFRASTNPGNIGHQWVKARFVGPDAEAALRAGTSHGVYWIDGRAFAPSRLRDNPALDPLQYAASLSHLPPVTRRRLLDGDWSIFEASHIRADWLRYYTTQGEHYRLWSPDGTLIATVAAAECLRFGTVDCAGSSDDVRRESQGKPASWSVIQTWDWHRATSRIILRDVRRGRWEFPQLCREVETAFRAQRMQWIGVEDEKTGRAVRQCLGQIAPRPLSHEGKDKLTRAATLLNALEQGRVFLPREAPWRDALEGEWLAWTGHPDEPADQIDAAAYAAREVFAKHITTQGPAIAGARW